MGNYNEDELYVWDLLFKDLSFKAKLKKVVGGLKCSKDSGEYKYARLQLIRLCSPLSAIVVPCLLVLLVIFFSQPVKSYDQTPDFKYLPTEKTPPVLEPIEIVPPPETKPEYDPSVDLSDPVLQDVSSQSSSFSHDTVMPDAVLFTHRPLVLKNLCALDAGTREKAIVQGNGNPAIEGAVLRALRWLKDVQEADGSWLQESGGGQGKGTAPAMTGLALLTFLAHGETTASAEFGSTIERALKWLITHQERDGHFRGRDAHDYSHPIATYAICEAYIVMQIPMLKEPAEKAVDIIVKGQHPDGGWDYNCKQSTRTDTSYMGWCLQALKAAKSAGLENKGLDEVLVSAVKGFKQNACLGGGFGYTSPTPSNLTGVGVLCLQLLNQSRDMAVLQGITWLDKVTCDWKNPWGKNPFYYWYYVTQVKFHVGGDIWNKWNNQFSKQLINNQRVVKSDVSSKYDSGYWNVCSEAEYCKSYVYNTSLCALMLQVYYRELATLRTIEDDGDIFASEKNEVPAEITFPES